MDRLALLFDLDGTLIDSIDLLVDCMSHTFAGCARAPSREQWIAGIGTPLRIQLAEWADDDAMVESLVQRYREYQDLHLERLTSTYPGVPDMLDWARRRGHALAIVTSKGRGMTDRSLAHVGLADAFDVVVTVEATPRHKPAADPVLFALERLGMSPADAIFVGDSPHDMHAGRAAAVQTVACEWGPFTRTQLAPAEPTWWAAAVADLVPIITEIEGVRSTGRPNGRSNHPPSPSVKSVDLDGDHARSSGEQIAT